uniref:protein-serine/threonine phosphatase n=1 Tax=Zea mays TaxID=4577 RepID=A0A804PB50_MAIZE
MACGAPLASSTPWRGPARSTVPRRVLARGAPVAVPAWPAMPRCGPGPALSLRSARVLPARGLLARRGARSAGVARGHGARGTRGRSRRLDAVQSGCSTLSIVKKGDLMVVANVGDSQVVLGTAFDNDAITSSSSSST